MLQVASLDGTPALVALPTQASYPLRTVIWFHGFRADALAHAGELQRLADAGFLAVGIDAVGHGARADGVIDERVARSEHGALPVMLEVIERTLEELPSVIEELVAVYGADRTRVSIVGVSMGAYLVYRAIALGAPVCAAVALLGSPEWPTDVSPHHSIAAFRRVALMSITAEHDEYVPTEPARRLHAALVTYYGDTVRQRYLELRDARHLTSAVHWHQAMTETVAWLETHVD